MQKTSNAKQGIGILRKHIHLDYEDRNMTSSEISHSQIRLEQFNVLQNREIHRTIIR